jgi:hypothetical protein
MLGRFERKVFVRKKQKRAKLHGLRAFDCRLSELKLFGEILMLGSWLEKAGDGIEVVGLLRLELIGFGEVSGKYGGGPR